MPMRTSYYYVTLYCNLFTAPWPCTVQETVVVEFYNRGGQLPYSIDVLRNEILKAIRDQILIPRHEDKLPLVSIL